MWKVLHSRWTVLLWLECSVLQWTVCGRYCTAGGAWNYGLKEVCYSEQYVECTAQQAESGIVGWVDCVTVNIMWKVLQSKWTMYLWLELCVLHWTVCGRYCTAGGEWYCELNGVCYSEHYVERTAQKVDSVLVAWIVFVTVNIMRKVLHRRWTVLLWDEWIVLQWTVCGRYFKAGGQCYCGLNGVCYSEHYVESTAQQEESGILVWK